MSSSDSLGCVQIDLLRQKIVIHSQYARNPHEDK